MQDFLGRGVRPNSQTLARVQALKDELSEKFPTKDSCVVGPVYERENAVAELARVASELSEVVTQLSKRFGAVMDLCSLFAARNIVNRTQAVERKTNGECDTKVPEF